MPTNLTVPSVSESIVQMPSKEEFKAELSKQLTAALDANKITAEQAKQLAANAVAKYKEDFATHGPALSAESIAEIDAKVAKLASIYRIPDNLSQEEIEKIVPMHFIRDYQQKLVNAEKFKLTEPEMAAMISEVGPLESFSIGFGGGLTKLWRGLTGQGTSEEDKQAFDWLKNYGNYGGLATAGEFAGETAPFVPAGMGAGNIASIPLRTAASTVLGGAEGFTIARGEGKDGGKGALAGAAVGGAFELGIPVVGRVGGALFRKITGRAPKAPIINSSGKFSDEFLSTISEANITPDQFLGDVQNVISGQGDDALSSAVAETVTAIKSQSGRDLKAIAASPDIDPEVLASADRLGIAADIPISVMARNEQFKDLEMGLSSIIASSTGARVADSTRMMMDKADETIQLLGGTVSDSGALSRRVYGEIDSTLNGLQQQSDELYDQLAKAVPPETAVDDISPLQEYMRGQLRRVAGQTDKLDPIDKHLMSTLMGSENKGVIVTYHMIDRERKKIGEQLARQSSPFPDASQAELSRAYGMLTELQGSVLESMDANLLPGGANKPLVDIWSSAKDLVSQRKQIEEKLVENFGKNFGTNIIPTLEAATFSLPKDGTDKFAKAIAAVPPELRQEAIATSLNRVFTAGSGQSQLNMSGFAQWWNKLNRNETAKNELFKHLSPEGQQRLTDLATVSEGFRKALLHKKDTGRVQTLFDSFDKPNGLLDKLYTGGGGVDPSTSAVVHVVRTAASKEKQNLANTADRLLASPSFKQLVVAAMDDPASKAAKNELRVLTESKVYNQWVDALPKDARIRLLQVGLIPFLIGEDEEQRNQTEGAQ